MPKTSIGKSKNGKYFVVKEDNKIVSRRRIKGSGLTLQQAKEVYKKNQTLYRDQTRLGKNTTVVSRFNFKNPKRNERYFIQGTLKNKFKGGYSKVTVSSKFLSTYDSFKQAKEETYQNFLKSVGEYYGGTYDKNEGTRRVKNGFVRNIKDGVLYYKRKKAKNKSN